MTVIGCLVMAFALAADAHAQQRPLVTEDPETIGSGLVLLEGGFDQQRAVALIVDLVTTQVARAVAEEREECAQIAEVLEPPGPETIAEVIRGREFTD